MRMLVLPGVLRPRSDAWLVAQVMREHGFARGASVLDVFTGSGVLGIAAARRGAQAVTAVDISRRAVLNARLNARLNGVRMRVLRGDLFAPVAGERFDLILANPPYLPSETNQLPVRGAAMAWEGGVDGRSLLDRLCTRAVEHLNATGHVLIVQSSLSGEQATLDALRSSGLGADVLVRLRGSLGPIATDRAEMLERRGLLASGEREEELLVLRGTVR
jgi:release factor glutamine methyltransferase